MRKYRNRAWRATGAVTALVTAAAIASVAPVQAQPAAPVQARTTAELSAWITDGWGGGTVTSQPAGINCHTTAFDPYGPGDPLVNPQGTCTASFTIGTTVTFTATPDAGSYVNFYPAPNPVTVHSGYNYTWAMFCPDDGLCSAG
ncbi:hypothetical protein AF335_04615 [Streptomyces eurocidicus]|uniref:Uncharacterized protein n=1 Tax=Streptomyces eurocidicus TaxID=66423 RepID=A0A2N8P3K5_STREU|nr:hypothetical protein [Streptomyces eurocidicus]MBB5117810.1 hypothetical protein [Streptomyces eurocidicus]MBF6055635.1 hypothetical protein [Streptomyces eurocidicus]PNE35593.1 hypothetical protein AF335_04615 [Streptomyces eurocidicus]